MSYPVFQAHKFMPDQPKLAERIRLLPRSRDALQEAGNLRGLQRADWFDVNIRVMDDVLEAKFAQHLSLRDMLLKTGNSELIEDSPVRRDSVRESLRRPDAHRFARSTPSGDVVRMVSDETS